MSFPQIIKRLSAFRARLVVRYADRRLRHKKFTVVSDDCVGGLIYYHFGLPCRSPFVGLGIAAQTYLTFLEHLRDPGALDVLEVSTPPDKGYPVISTRHGLLQGLHYASEDSFRRTYERRCKTILWDRLFFKIDLGKKNYTPEDIDRWNALRLPNSVAIYPDTPRFRSLTIHNGVALPHWEPDGARQFHNSCRCFDIFDWLNQGALRTSASYRCMQFLLMEQPLRKRILGWFHPSPPPCHWHR